MAKFNVYEQQTSPGAVTAGAGAFGGHKAAAVQKLGQAGQELGSTLGAIEQRKRTREETIERVRTLNGFSQFAEQEKARMETEEDLSSSDAVSNYQGAMRDHINSALENYKGSAQGRAELHAQLEAQYGNYSSGMYKASVSAQYKVMGTHMESSINAIASQAGQLPSGYTEHLNRLHSEIDKMAPALTPEQEEAFRNQGITAITASTVQTYVNEGNPEAARAILADPELVKHIPDETMRSMRTNILTKERSTEKIEIVRRRRLDEAAAVMGVPFEKLTPDQKLRASYLPALDDLDTRPMAQKIAEFESLKGDAATEAEMTKLQSMTGSSFDLGNSLDANILEGFGKLAPALASNQATPDDLRQMDTMVTHYTQPRQYQNPTTGLMETRQNRLPPFVTEAYRQAGRTPPVGAIPSGLPGSPGAPGASPTAVLDELPQSPDQTIWARRKNLVGILPSMHRGIGKMPLGIGELAGGGGAPAEDRQYAELRQKTLVTALQDSPRFAEGEREYLNETFSIVGGAIDSDSAWERRAFAIDDYLQQEQKRATNDIQSPDTTTQIRQAALADLKTISNFREHFGAPRRYTAEEAGKLPEGTEYYGMDGAMRKRKGTQGTSNE